MKSLLPYSPLALIVLLLFDPPFVFSTEYRVSSAAQIAAAMSTALPGDTLTMTNGTWLNESIMFAGYGTDAAPILLRAESYGGVILTGTSVLRISGRHLVADGLLFRNGYSSSGAVVEFQGDNGQSDSCRFTNSSIIDYNPADLAIDYKWVSLYGTYNRVDHCYIGGKKHQGSTLVIWLDGITSNYHRIDHNYFAPRPPLPSNGGETIRVGTGAYSTTRSFVLVEYNYFEQCNGDAEIISNKSCDNIYRYNTFVSCAGTLSMRQGNRATIEGNFFFGNNVSGTGAIRLTGEDHKVFNNYVSGVYDDGSGCGLALMNGTVSGVTPSYPQVKRAMVAFNTFVKNRYSIGFGVNSNGGTLAPDSCTIANNVAYATSAKPVVTVYTSPTNLTWRGNIFYGASLGIPQPSGITWADPQLKLVTDRLWRPDSSSPVIDASDSSDLFPFVADDMDGQPRDTFADIGADERSLSPILRRPVTPADVGPPPEMITGVKERREGIGTIPENFALEQNYPNPFNPTTAISFALPVECRVKVQVFNTLGQMVDQPVNTILSAGHYSVSWNAQGASGMYFYRLEATGLGDPSIRFIRSNKMVLLR